MNDKKYFEVFTKYQHDKYELYNELKALIQEEIIDARGVENAKFYDALVVLNNSENNAGWEDRHSERISFTNKTMRQWEMDVKESRKNLWLVTTESAKYVCVKFRSRFFIKDCGAMLPVKEPVISFEQL